MNVIVPVLGDNPNPEVVDPAHCYQCEGVDCLLNPVLAVCVDVGGQVQDVCTTDVSDARNPPSSATVRSIVRGGAVSGRYGQDSTLPPDVGYTPGAFQDESCGFVESTVLTEGLHCTLVCDGEAKEGCNASPALVPQDAWLNGACGVTSWPEPQHNLFNRQIGEIGAHRVHCAVGGPDAEVQAVQCARLHCHTTFKRLRVNAPTFATIRQDSVRVF